MSQIIDRRRFNSGVLAACSLLASAKVATALAAAVRTSEPRLVFAHYMVCCPRDGDEAPAAALAAEIKQAQSRGIDAFALNCGSWSEEPRYRATATKLFRAAASLGTGFKLFFSADGLSPKNVIAMVSEFYNHPGMLRVAGKPLLSTFDGDADWAKAFLDPLEDAEKPVTFVPFFFPEGRAKVFTARNVAKLIADNSYVDGFFLFGAAGSGSEIARASEKVGEAWRRAGKLYMAPVSPYYRGLGYRDNYRVFETRGFQGMAQQWEAAIAVGAQWVEVVTWNDWSEATYVEDLGAPATDRVAGGYWGKLLSHAAYLAASEYYIRWFKTGVRRIDRDDLYWFYRLSPRAIPGRSTPRGRKPAFPKGVETLEDQVFVSAFLTAPARIEIESGKRRYQLDIDAGVHHLGVDFALGAQKFSVSRNGRTILAGDGAFPITDDNWANYDYLSGQARRI
ncbi:MAG TPA: endo-1,3-alpha-glucanase family glycosylhydrolase [Stellaceae bacterium]|nr:endo-1,3-alpha-glucanase family glycosylhydrolase [Stellaceae bacterium]